MGKYRLDYFSKYYFYEEDKFSQEVEEGDYILEQIKKSSRHYAKRQYTFFHHQLPVQWITVNFDHFSKTVDEAISIINRKL